MRAKLVVAGCAALVLAGVSLAGTRPPPVLRVDAKNTVRGSHFKAHELVQLVITWDVRQVRVVRASAGGSLAVPLPAPPDSCPRLLIRAIGASGDRALVTLPQGLCPPPSVNRPDGAQTDNVTPAADGVASRNLG